MVLVQAAFVGVRRVFHDFLNRASPMLVVYLFWNEAAATGFPTPPSPIVHTIRCIRSRHASPQIMLHVQVSK